MMTEGCDRQIRKTDQAVLAFYRTRPKQNASRFSRPEPCPLQEHSDDQAWQQLYVDTWFCRGEFQRPWQLVYRHRTCRHEHQACT